MELVCVPHSTCSRTRKLMLSHLLPARSSDPSVMWTLLFEVEGNNLVTYHSSTSKLRFRSMKLVDVGTPDRVGMFRNKYITSIMFIMKNMRIRLPLLSFRCLSSGHRRCRTSIPFCMSLISRPGQAVLYFPSLHPHTYKMQRWKSLSTDIMIFFFFFLNELIQVLLSKLQSNASWMRTVHSWLQHFSLRVRGSSCLWKCHFLPIKNLSQMYTSEYLYYFILNIKILYLYSEANLAKIIAVKRHLGERCSISYKLCDFFFQSV